MLWWSVSPLLGIKKNNPPPPPAIMYAREVETSQRELFARDNPEEFKKSLVLMWG